MRTTNYRARYRMRCCHRLVIVLAMVTGCSDTSVEDNTHRVTVASRDPEPQRTLTPVRCDLRCEFTKDGVVAKLLFKNTSQGDILLTKRNMLVGVEGARLAWSPFTITNNGVEMQYIGMLAKRPEPTNDDYCRLRPGEVLETMTNISRSYKLTRTTGSHGCYRIYYSCVNIIPRTESIVEIVSNIVEVAGQTR